MQRGLSEFKVGGKHNQQDLWSNLMREPKPANEPESDWVARDLGEPPELDLLGVLLP